MDLSSLYICCQTCCRSSAQSGSCSAELHRWGAAADQTPATFIIFLLFFFCKTQSRHYHSTTCCLLCLSIRCPFVIKVIQIYGSGLFRVRFSGWMIIVGNVKRSACTERERERNRRRSRSGSPACRGEKRRSREKRSRSRDRKSRDRRSSSRDHKKRR